MTDARGMLLKEGCMGTVVFSGLWGERHLSRPGGDWVGEMPRGQAGSRWGGELLECRGGWQRNPPHRGLACVQLRQEAGLPASL